MGNKVGLCADAFMWTQDLGVNSTTWSARKNHDGIAEEEWAGQMQENSKRLLNPLYAVFTIAKESM